MRFSLHSPARDADQVTRRAVAAEALGFHALFFADGHLNNLDGFQAMTVCALRTERLRFGIAATTMAYRDPTTLALSAATSNEFSGSRAILGLGTGDGSTYRLGRKATRLAEFAAGLATIRELLGGRPIEVPRGDEGAGSVTLTSGQLPVPVYVAAEGPRSLRVAGRYADGIMLGTGFDLDVLEWAQAHIAAGARKDGRELSHIDIAMAGMIYVHEDGDLARDRVRARLANRAHHNFRSPTRPCRRTSSTASSSSWPASTSASRSRNGRIPRSSRTTCCGASPSSGRRTNAWRASGSWPKPAYRTCC